MFNEIVIGNENRIAMSQSHQISSPGHVVRVIKMVGTRLIYIQCFPFSASARLLAPYPKLTQLNSLRIHFQPAPKIGEQIKRREFEGAT